MKFLKTRSINNVASDIFFDLKVIPILFHSNAIIITQLLSAAKEIGGWRFSKCISVGHIFRRKLFQLAGVHVPKIMAGYSPSSREHVSLSYSFLQRCHVPHLKRKSHQAVASDSDHDRWVIDTGKLLGEMSHVFLFIASFQYAFARFICRYCEFYKHRFVFVILQNRKIFFYLFFLFSL